MSTFTMMMWAIGGGYAVGYVAVCVYSILTGDDDITQYPWTGQ
jgi:hypothetical protein